MEAPITRTCKTLIAVALTISSLGAVSPAQAKVDKSEALDMFVKARAASADGDTAFATRTFAQVLNAAPDNELVASRAYRQALGTGDMPLAIQAQSVMAAKGKAAFDGALVALADQLHRKDYVAANSTLESMNKPPLDFMVPIIKAWMKFDTDPAGAMKMLSGTPTSSFGRRYSSEALALMEVAAGDSTAGIARLNMLGLDDRNMVDLKATAARLLAGRGEKDQALALIQGDDPVFQSLREHLGRGVKADTNFGVAHLYARLGADLNNDKTAPLSILLSRCALYLDGDLDFSRLILADLLSRGGDFESAKRVIAEIDPSSDYYRAARLSQVIVLERDDETKAALQIAQQLAKNGNGGEVRLYAELLAQDGQYDASAEQYARARAMGGAGPDWYLLLSQGSVLDQAGNWKAAEPLLDQAVKAAPNQPLVLNYLGYALLERGRRLDEAQKLIERAYQLKSNDPSITDSLAWAYYVRGDTAKALPLILKAVYAKPADADIQEHLGDIYWRLGRHYEARYAWRNAAIYADGKQAERIKLKLADGPSGVN